MAEHIQTTRMRRLPTVFGVCTTFSDEILDVKRFAQVHWLKSLTVEGKCLCWRAKPAHLEGHLPVLSDLSLALNGDGRKCQRILNRNRGFAMLKTKASFAAAAKLMLNLHMFRCPSPGLHKQMWPQALVILASSHFPLARSIGL